MKPKFAIYLGLLAGLVFVAWLFGAPTGFMLSSLVAILTFLLGANGRYSRGYFDGWEDAGKAWRERGHDSRCYQPPRGVRVAGTLTVPAGTIGGYQPVGAVVNPLPPPRYPNGPYPAPAIRPNDLGEDWCETCEDGCETCRPCNCETCRDERAGSGNC